MVWRSSIWVKNRFYYQKWNWSSRVIKPKINRALNHIKMHFSTYWETLNSKCLETHHNGEAQNEVKLNFQVEFDLEDQCQSPPKTIGTLTNLFCTSGTNFMILAWMGDKLQTSSGLTHTHTHRLKQATTIPEGQNWPWVTMGNMPGRFQNSSMILSASMHYSVWYCSMWSRPLYLVHSPLYIEGQVTQLQTHSAGP